MAPWDDAVRQGFLPERLLRRADLKQPNSSRSARGLRTSRRGDSRDQHLRREPREAGTTGSPTTPRRSTRPRRSWPSAAAAGQRRRRDRAVGRPHRAVRRDVARGAFAHFQRQVRGLVAGGVDGFILETFSDLDEIHEALRAVRSVSDLPVIAQMTVATTADALRHGPRDVRQAAHGVVRRGVNCSVGPAACSKRWRNW